MLGDNNISYFDFEKIFNIYIENVERISKNNNKIELSIIKKMSLIW
jgi:hypothetical protein